MTTTTRWQFEALGIRIAVVSDCPLLTPKLHVLLAGYAVTAETPTWSYRFREFGASVELYKDGEQIYTERPDDTLNFFLLDMYLSLTARQTGRWVLHAAAVVQDGQALVLAGPSNSGKSTMTRALLRNGWSYLSEEIVSLGPNSIDALRRPMHASKPSELAEIPGFGAARPMPSGPTEHWVAAPVGPHVGAVQIRAMVRLYYQPEQTTRLTQLTSSEGLLELWPCRMNSGLETAVIAAELVSRQPCYQLSADDEITALHHLLSL